MKNGQDWIEERLNSSSLVKKSMGLTVKIVSELLLALVVGALIGIPISMVLTKAYLPIIPTKWVTMPVGYIVAGAALILYRTEIACRFGTENSGS